MTYVFVCVSMDIYFFARNVNLFQFKWEKTLANHHVNRDQKVWWILAASSSRTGPITVNCGAGKNNRQERRLSKPAYF